jgi:hypothetical protein
MTKLNLGLFLALMALPACADQVNTVDWYVDHPDERKAEIARCDNNPGELQNTPDCINAKEAGRKAVEVKAKQALDNAGNRIDNAVQDLTK